MAIMAIILTGCERDQFRVAGNPVNMHGIWGSWNEEGNFEFFDFVGTTIVQGYVKPEQGIISYIRVGGYHFHGVLGHAWFNQSIFEDGMLQSIDKDFNFSVRLTSDGQQMRITDLVDNNNSWELYYMGNYLEALNVEMGQGVTFFDMQLAFVVDQMWGFANITGDDFE